MYTTILSIIFILVAIAFIALPYYLWIENTKKRSKVLAGWASSRNWSFNKFPLDSVQLRQQVNAGSFFNIVEGDIDERKIRVFDCQLVAGNNKKIEQSYSVVVLDTGMSLKPLFIRTEKFLDKMTDFVWLNDIDFESTEFSEKFYVKATDSKWAYDVLSPDAIEFLLESPRFNLDFRDKYIVAYRSFRLLKIADFEDAIKVVTGIFDRLPASLVQELKVVK